MKYNLFVILFKSCSVQLEAILLKASEPQAYSFWKTIEKHFIYFDNYLTWHSTSHQCSSRLFCETAFQNCFPGGEMIRVTVLDLMNLSLQMICTDFQFSLSPIPTPTSLLLHVPLTSPLPSSPLLPQNASDLYRLGVTSAHG